MMMMMTLLVTISWAVWKAVLDLEREVLEQMRNGDPRRAVCTVTR